MKAYEIDAAQANSDPTTTVSRHNEIITPGAPKRVLEFDRVPFGRIYAHAVRTNEAIDRIFAEVDRGRGGFVVTPNVDHICIAETDPELRAAYREAFLSLPDGQPLLWMARKFNLPLPEKVSGSDLITPLLREAARLGKTVYFLGSTDASCVEAVRRLGVSIPTLRVVGWRCPHFDPYGESQTELFDGFDEIQRLKPDLVLFAFGNPKQEYAMWRYQEKYFPAVGLGVGASIDFLAGSVERSPKWMSDLGLEWAFRLSQEPGRLWRRYLVRDRAILGIFWRTRRQIRSQRATKS
jgi:N-acetylglucosaminyldiphosphoundecaprenol N-acetyl-beta-D-mannosaminyltransferase